MHCWLQSFTDWLQNTPLALNISSSYWAYPFVQLTHFTGLSIWLATSVALDLHLLGIGKRTQTPLELLRALIVWNWIGFGVAVVGGVTLFSTAASAFIDNPAFEVKLGILLPVALTWHVIVQLKTPTWGQTIDAPKAAKIAGFIEIVLWSGVAMAAATIPYF